MSAAAPATITPSTFRAQIAELAAVLRGRPLDAFHQVEALQHLQEDLAVGGVAAAQAGEFVHVERPPRKQGRPTRPTGEAEQETEGARSCSRRSRHFHTHNTS